MRSLFGAPGPYGLEPPPPPSPNNGKPSKKPVCLQCFEKPAVRLEQMGLFANVVAFCSVACAATHALDEYCNAHPLQYCDFCGNATDHFGECKVCDQVYACADLQSYLPDQLEPIDEKDNTL